MLPKLNAMFELKGSSVDRFVGLLILAVCMALPANPGFAEDSSKNKGEAAEEKYTIEQVLNDTEEAFHVHREGDYEKALDLYSKVLRFRMLKAKDRAVVFLLRGESYKENEEYDRAIADFTRALRIKSKYIRAYYERGLCYEKKGDLAKAYLNIKRASELDAVKEKYLKKLAVLKGRMEKKGIKIPEG